MKPIRKNNLNAVTTGASIYLLVSIALPLIFLAVAGLVWSWQSGIVLPVLLVWLIVSAVTWFVFVWKPRQRLLNESERLLQADTVQLPHSIEPHAAWTAQDRDIQARVHTLINTDLDGPVTLEWLRSRAIDIATFVAREYQHNKNQDNKHAALTFTLPEGLLMVSMVSTRYRELVLSHLPFAVCRYDHTGNGVWCRRPP